MIRSFQAKYARKMRTIQWYGAALCQSGQMTDRVNEVITMSVYNSTHIFFVIAAQPPLSSLLSVCRFCQKLQHDHLVLFYILLYIVQIGSLLFSRLLLFQLIRCQNSEATIYVNKWACGLSPRLLRNEQLYELNLVCIQFLPVYERIINQNQWDRKSKNDVEISPKYLVQIIESYKQRLSINKSQIYTVTNMQIIPVQLQFYICVI
ncbi:Hypothetical_protein [Hexamita inflata]|uniref:Hypothetical_protein n=1 Tax=Hexamita inflata TaxID=28002 RepID=A0AA86RNW9_9EUKA|nr:Hypothetical protein HINF_LOCUS65893 [Hexamita inflata]